MWTISLPLRVAVSKKKEFSLNLNQYRNTNPFTLNKAKENFDEIAKELLKGIPKLKQCTLEYVFYPGSRQICDTMNICSIVDKFFSDSLKNHGILEDDNYKFIIGHQFCFGGIDRENPRVDVTIRSSDSIPEEEKPTMKIVTLITLTRADLNTALHNYLGQQLNLTPDADLDITFAENGDVQIHVEQNAVGQKSGKVTTRQTRAAVQETATQPQTTTPAPVVSEPHKVSEPEAQPIQEAPAEPEKKEEAPPAPAPAKGSSLFAGFKRPNA